MAETSKPSMWGPAASCAAEPGVLVEGSGLGALEDMFATLAARPSALPQPQGVILVQAAPPFLLANLKAATARVAAVATTGLR